MNCKNAHTEQCLLNEEGFTLLEIIAVIVIMSILAVVAVPKYFDLQEEARKKAFSAGISEAIGRVNGHFAESVLNGQRPGSIVYDEASLSGNEGQTTPVDLGDFELSVDGNATHVYLTITGKPGTEMEGVETDPDVQNEIHVPKPGL